MIYVVLMTIMVGHLPVFIVFGIIILKKFYILVWQAIWQRDLSSTMEFYQLKRDQSRKK